MRGDLMNTLLTGSTYATKHLEAWYHAILTQNVVVSHDCYHAAAKEKKKCFYKEIQKMHPTNYFLIY